MKIKTIIVDDEPLARQFLSEMLADDNEIEIICECSDGTEALKAIKDFSPDLLFLDIQMSEMDGFTVLKNLEIAAMPIIVFVTAYSQYALSAFEACALDYLLKPFDDIRLNQAMERVKLYMKGKEKINVNAQIQQFLVELKKQKTSDKERLLIKTNGKFVHLLLEEIIWITAEENYVKVYTQTKSYLVRDSISNVENQLPSQQFARIHRSTIISVNHISELQPMFHGSFEVKLSNGIKLTMSRRFRANLTKILGEF